MIKHDASTLARLIELMCGAIAHNGAGQPEPALAALDQALALDCNFLPAHMQRAALLLQMGDAAAAVRGYQDCLDIAPTFDDARDAHRQALLALVAQCESALADPGANTLQHHLQLANARLALDQPQPALTQIDAVLAAQPDDFAASALRADILLRLNRHEDALACYQGESAATASPERLALIACNRATILRQMGHAEAALAQFDAALHWHPAFAQAGVGRAHMLLLLGRFAAGWQQHEARHAIAELARTHPHSEQAQWLPGDDVRGRHVLLWAEQGQGDALQFARYIGLVAARAARTTVCCPPGLASLLAAAFPSCEFVVDDKQLPPHDLIASLLSLPLLLDLPEPAAAPAPPYLHADPGRAGFWRAWLAGLSPPLARRPRIGIAWAGRQYATIHYTRDIPLTELLPLFALPIDFVALQPEVPVGDNDALGVIEAGQQAGRLHRVALADWADSAALVSQLDAVISVDSAVAHLAGALACPVWLLLRLEGEWRWGMAPDSNAWYPGMRLARQQVRGQWREPVDQVYAACAALCGQ